MTAYNFGDVVLVGFPHTDLRNVSKRPASGSCSASREERFPMLNATVKKEIINQIGRLDYEHQRRVLDFARALAVFSPKGVPGKQLLSFAGTIPAKDLLEMGQAIEDNCEKVDADEW
jgi:hypothetical protein